MVLVASTEVELKVPAAVMWKAFVVDSHVLLPKVVPEIIGSIEILEGDGGVGTVRLVKFGPGLPGNIPDVKEKLETVDEEKLTVCIVGLEGGPIGTLVSSSKVTVTFVGDGGSCVAKWSLEVEPLASGELPPPQNPEQGAIHTFKALEGYLLSQAN